MVVASGPMLYPTEIVIIIIVAGPVTLMMSAGGTYAMVDGTDHGLAAAEEEHIR